MPASSAFLKNDFLSYKRIVNEVNVNNNLPLMTDGLKSFDSFGVLS